jgi:hypothetical protein
MFVLNLILSIGVIFMVVAPLVYAIYTGRAAHGVEAVRARTARSRFRLGQAEAHRASGRTRIGQSLRPYA